MASFTISLDHTVTAEGKRVVLVDCGVKHSIIRGLIARGVEVIRVPYDYDYTEMEYDGVYVSNGPGCTCNCEKTVEILKKVLSADKPVFGFGMGYHLMAKSLREPLEVIIAPVILGRTK